MALSEVKYASRATSRTSRRVGYVRSLTESWLHWEASPAISAAVESLVMLPVLVRLLVVACGWALVLVRLLPDVRHPRHCRRRHRPEVAVLGLVQLLPILLVLEEQGP